MATCHAFQDAPGVCAYRAIASPQLIEISVRFWRDRKVYVGPSRCILESVAR